MISQQSNTIHETDAVTTHLFKYNYFIRSSEYVYSESNWLALKQAYNFVKAFAKYNANMCECLRTNKQEKQTRHSL